MTLGRLDVLIFTAAIGENSAALRRTILNLLSPLGFEIDEKRNNHNGKFSGHVITKARNDWTDSCHTIRDQYYKTDFAIAQLTATF